MCRYLWCCDTLLLYVLHAFLPVCIRRTIRHPLERFSHESEFIDNGNSSTTAERANTFVVCTPVRELSGLETRVLDGEFSYRPWYIWYVMVKLYIMGTRHHGNMETGGDAVR